MINAIGKRFKKASLEARFFWIIGISFGGFVVGLPEAHHNFCAFSEIPRAAGTQSETYRQQTTPGEEITVIFLGQQDASNRYEQYGQNVTPNHFLSRHTWLCDAHITDIFLLYFTFCLIVVGYFTMRSADRAAKQTERAIIFGGAANQPPDMPPPSFKKRNYAVGVGVTNYGRSVGVLKEVYVEFSLTEPSGEKAVYNAANGDFMKFDTGIAPTSDNSPIFVCFGFSDFPSEQYMFGYVKYTDIYRELHTARFCGKIDKDRRGLSNSCGSDAYNEWD